MNIELYQSIFTRKSFHTFKGLEEKLTNEDLYKIQNYIDNNLDLLDNSIKFEIKVVKADQTTCNRGEEYCILFYSQEKEGYLQNIGYIGQQLDLFLVSNNIATLRCGLAKPLKPFSSLKYVIMICISKCTDKNKYRKDMYTAKRKSMEEIWEKNYYKDIGNIVRFSPSACNSQPRLVKGNNKELFVYRYTKKGRSGLMSETIAHYYNSIDIGIFMYILEMCLYKNNIDFIRKLVKETNENNYFLNAIYKIK